MSITSSITEKYEAGRAAPSYYNLIKVLQEIQKKNNIYGKSGYTLSLGKDSSDIVITGDGTKNKDGYFVEPSITNIRSFENKISAKSVFFIGSLFTSFV